MIIEVDTTNPELVSWYERSGYLIKSRLEDYYSIGIDAFKMTKMINPQMSYKTRSQNIIIAEKPLDFLSRVETVEVVSPEEYLGNEKYQKSDSMRVFNLCDSYPYGSKGYYMSLLATARDHKVIPNVAMIQDITSTFFVQCLNEELDTLINKTFSNSTCDRIDYSIFLGYELNGTLSKLSKSMYQLFEAPLVHFKFIKSDRWLIESVRLGNITEVEEIDRSILSSIAKNFFSQKKMNRPKLKNFEYDLAILVNDKEKNPPSNKSALNKFKTAAEKNNFFVEFITKDDIHRINEFDALFIRETTAVNNHTYEISRYAHAEGLIVIDDPWSILKCSNKFYLQERMKKANIKMPHSVLLTNSEQSIKIVEEELKYPIILKEPDSAFSLGVHKVTTTEELIEKSKLLLEHSEFVIAQEYMFSDFDWRIGIIDNQPIFACKYYMAKGHWQIYNWSAARKNKEGLSETFNLEEVPKEIIETALKATSHIGDGLYGVDLKYINGQCYLIEINDNPNIDHLVEDAVSGNFVYDTIITSIRNRILKARNINKYIEL